MKALTYLIYIVLWEGLCIGGAAYITIWRGCSGWWWLLALLLSGAAYKPKDWAKLWD